MVAIPRQSTMPCNPPGSSPVNSFTFTPNLFSGGLMEFCLGMLIYAMDGFVIGAVFFGLGYLCFFILTVLHDIHRNLEKWVKKHGPSIREWYAGRSTQARGWFTARYSLVRGYTDRSGSEVGRFKRLEEYPAEALFDSDSELTSVWQNKESSDATA
ncbi:hypothetical protein BV25DRAFT_1831447 [Artomyces pyxidatus]|uniref:Uncharacterized protein n=1 Tax=Artomyces pyxidatus TaxID=48021 RepID=A0ACB8SL38_9AGAM|nr:hypothetical protein BV25DRAFT_1831447 [Artomyces pyxidatus]